MIFLSYIFKEKKMKKIMLCVFLCCVVFVSVYAEPKQSAVTGIAFDYALVGRQNDFGMSAAVTSPWLFYNSAALKINAGCFFPNPQRKKFYYVLDVSLMGGTLMQTANIRLYGGGGPVFVFPAQKDKPAVLISGQGFFGFEFFTGKRSADFSVFTEMGGGGLGFTAKAGMRYTIPMLPRSK